MIIDFPKITVRAARDEDEPALIDLVHEVWHGTYDRDLPRSHVRRHTRSQSARLVKVSSSQRWVATLGPRLVGYCGVLGNCIDQLWVSAAYRRRGVGSALVDQALQALSRRGFRYAQAGSEHFNLPMKSFLRNQGWRLIAEETQPIGPGCVVGVLVFSLELSETEMAHDRRP